MGRCVEFVVRSHLPPKKGVAISMWGNPTEVPRLMALRKAAAEAMEEQPAFRSQIHIELEIHYSSSELSPVGDLDNFIGGVCDGLMAADPHAKVDNWPAEAPADIKPDRRIAIEDDCGVVSIRASKALEPTGETWYKVVLKGD